MTYTVAFSPKARVQLVELDTYIEAPGERRPERLPSR